MRAAEREADDQQQDHRNGGLGPSLGQDLAEEMVRPVAVTQARQGLAHRPSSNVPFQEIDVAGDVPGDADARSQAAITSSGR